MASSTGGANAASEAISARPKRQRYLLSLSGQTPQSRRLQSQPLASPTSGEALQPRALFSVNQATSSSWRKWTRESDLLLVRSVMTSKYADRQWPHFSRNNPQWDTISEAFHTRSPAACRGRAARLSTTFTDAKAAYATTLKEMLKDETGTPTRTREMWCQTKSNQSDLEICYFNLGKKEQIKFLDKAFGAWAKSSGLTFIVDDYISISFKAMINLEKSKRSNIFYEMARCFGLQERDGEVSRMPLDRMPTGYLEYLTFFYNSPEKSIIPKCPTDYLQWAETMLSNFDSRWLCLHRGPGWSEDSKQTTAVARINNPCPSRGTLYRNPDKNEISKLPVIQKSVLQSVKKAHPDSALWIKADACDVVPGVQESVTHEWAGDVDVNDGKLDAQYKAYQAFLNDVNSICEGKKTKPTEISPVIENCVIKLQTYETTLRQVLTENEKKAGKAAQKGREKTSLKWDVRDGKQGLEDIRSLVSLARAILTALSQERDTRTISKTTTALIAQFRSKAVTVASGINRLLRTPASHVLVFMVRPKKRDKKPYAMPVQIMPCRGMTETLIRKLANDLKQALTDNDMNVVGFVTDGEFNTLRSRGNSRPINVLQIRSDVRKIISHWSESKMSGMLSIKPGSSPPQAVVHNAAVTLTVLQFLQSFSEAGLPRHTALRAIRHSSVHSLHTWSGELLSEYDESNKQCYMSILAQLEFSATVREYARNGIDFRTFLYVPEIDEITGNVFHKREDHNHILKRIASHTRAGGPASVNIGVLREAMLSPDTCLTQTAAEGLRRQDVGDAERLLSASVAEFLKSKGHLEEATYFQTVHDWHLASEGRGLTQLQRCKNNYRMLEYILDELMPWHRSTWDFSSMEVNQ